MRVTDPLGDTPATHVVGATTVVASPASVPQLPGYAVLRQLGRGGMGEVWLAEHATLHRTVAVKILRPDLGRDQAFVERFLREARAAARITHPGVITVHDAGRAGDHLYLAMEYMPGGDLRARIANGKGLPLAEAGPLMLEIAAALQAIHDAGLVHRDLKPENILLDGEGRIRIADLGLARSERGDDRMTATGLAMGTPAYMSPEQAEGSPDVDARSDVYALGATLFALLSGRPPFTGATPWVVVAQVMDQPAPDVRQFAPGVPAAVAVVIRRALDKQRSRRQASAQVFAEELRTALAKPALRLPSMTWSLRRAWQWPIIVLALVTFGLWLTFHHADAAGDRSSPTATSSAVPAATKTSVATPESATTARPVAQTTTVETADKAQSERNPFLAIRDSFREVRTAVRGTLTDTLALPLADAAAATRSALTHQHLTILKERGDDSQIAIECRLSDGDSVTVTLRPDGKKSQIAIQIGTFGDKERSRAVLEWIRREF